MNGDLEKQVNALKRQLESETLLRIDLENKNKTLREELQFNEQIHETVRINTSFFLGSLARCIVLVRRRNSSTEELRSEIL